MGAVQLEQVEACARGAAGGLHELGLDPQHVLARHRSRRLGGLAQGSAEGARSGQAPAPSARGRPPTQGRSQAPLRPAWESCIPMRAGVQACTKSTTRLQAACVLVVPEAGAGGRDARVGRDVSHLRHDQARAAHGAAAQMHQVPVVQQAVHGRVPAHGRDHQPVGERQAAQPERAGRAARPAARAAARRSGDAVQREGRVATTRARRPGRPAHQARVPPRQVVPGDALAAREQVEGELQRRLVQVARGVLEPLQAGLRPRAGCGPRPAAARARSPRQRGHVAGRAVRAPGPGRWRPPCASLVPEPIEKCAVCAASPISTSLPWGQRSLRTVGKRAPDRAVAQQAVAAQLLAEQLARAAPRCGPRRPGRGRRGARSRRGTPR